MFRANVAASTDCRRRRSARSRCRVETAGHLRRRADGRRQDVVGEQSVPRGTPIATLTSAVESTPASERQERGRNRARHGRGEGIERGAADRQVALKRLDRRSAVVDHGRRDDRITVQLQPALAMPALPSRRSASCGFASICSLEQTCCHQVHNINAKDDADARI
jgi:hypothetical protein